MVTPGERLIQLLTRLKALFQAQCINKNSSRKFWHKVFKATDVCSISSQCIFFLLGGGVLSVRFVRTFILLCCHKIGNFCYRPSLCPHLETIWSVLSSPPIVDYVSNYEDKKNKKSDVTQYRPHGP